MVWLIIIPSLLVFVYCFSKPVKDFVDTHLLRCTLGWCQEAFAPQQFDGDQHMWNRLKAWLRSIFTRKPVEASKPEVATPIPPTPVKPVVEPPVKPVTPVVVPTSPQNEEEYQVWRNSLAPSTRAFTAPHWSPAPEWQGFGPLPPVVQPVEGQILDYTGERLRVRMTKGVPVRVRVAEPYKTISIVGVEGGFDASYTSTPGALGAFGGAMFTVPADRIVTIYASTDVKLAHIN